jgi:hypothetical protein
MTWKNSTNGVIVSSKSTATADMGIPVSAINSISPLVLQPKIMNLPTELNIKITHEGSTIRLSLPELGIATTAGDLWEALGNLKDELSEGFLAAMDDLIRRKVDGEE